MKVGDIVGSYRLEKRLGKGVTASTWLAQRTDSFFVLKIFDIAETTSWKPLDQCMQEADTLRTINHPNIPKYIENFEAIVEGDFLFVLAMEYIEGQTIDSYIASGKKFTENQIEEILAELADILAYIGSLRPPIVHRDINPRNIILKQDGHIVLVDFSGVQDAIRTALYPSATLVGTAGYIPLEQVSGRATHRSDLYSAAATAIFMLTGRNPTELPLRNLKIDLSGLLYVSAKLSYVLNNWLDPDPDHRSLAASNAALILREKMPIPERKTETPFKEAQSSNGINDSSFAHTIFSDFLRLVNKEPETQNYPSELPSGSTLTVQDLDQGLYIKLPHRRGGSNGLTIFPFAWLGFVFFWTTTSMRMHAPLIFSLFSIPFWIAGIAMVKSLLKPALADIELYITQEGLLKKSTGFLSNSTQQFRISDVGSAKVRRSSIQVNNRHVKELAIDAGSGTLTFGAGLSERELYFLEKRINDELFRLKQLPQSHSEL